MKKKQVSAGRLLELNREYWEIENRIHYVRDVTYDLVVCVASGLLMSQAKNIPSWGWKLATTPEDAHNFLNGIGTYKTPVKRARIFATDKGQFYIFYRK